MSQQIKSERLDFSSARNLPPEQAAFFHLGQPQLVAEGIAFFPALGNCIAFVGENGVLIVDTAQERFTPAIISGLRANYSQLPVEAIIYTHGHVDHVTGAESFIGEAESRGDNRPQIIAHRDLPRRFDRYRLLARQNDHINRIQFNLPADAKPFSHASLTYPDTTYDDAITTTVGGTIFELHHCRGETDDETWVWCPSLRALCTGDTFVWCSPNAGNPYKVQRYALDWAHGLEQMAALRPLYLMPGHGPVLTGEDRIQEALLTTAHFLRSIHDQVVAGMNEGKWLEDIIRGIDWPPMDKPWLQPVYDHPEFIARNVHRLYGGWYDGNPANILPAHSEDIAAALIAATGVEPILARARTLRDDGDLQLACHLADFVRKGDPSSREAWELWRELFSVRASQESSLMARGAFHAAVREAEERLKELP